MAAIGASMPRSRHPPPTRLGHLVDEQRNAVGALDDVLPEVAGSDSLPTSQSIVAPTSRSARRLTVSGMTWDRPIHGGSNSGRKVTTSSGRRIRLHPSTKGSRMTSGLGAVLILPNRDFWKFAARAGDLMLEESVYLAGPHGSTPYGADRRLWPRPRPAAGALELHPHRSKRTGLASGCGRGGRSLDVKRTRSGDRPARGLLEKRAGERGDECYSFSAVAHDGA